MMFWERIRRHEKQEDEEEEEVQKIYTVTSKVSMLPYGRIDIAFS